MAFIAHTLIHLKVHFEHHQSCRVMQHKFMVVGVKIALDMDALAGTPNEQQQHSPGFVVLLPNTIPWGPV
jgi:hypothetical protein